jgi:hypothetical protein
MNWSKFEEEIEEKIDSETNDSADDVKSEDSLQSAELTFPTDQCIFCVGDNTYGHFIHARNSDLTRYGGTWRTSISVDSLRPRASRAYTRSVRRMMLLSLTGWCG